MVRTLYAHPGPTARGRGCNMGDSHKAIARYRRVNWLDLSARQEVSPSFQGHVTAVFVWAEVHLSLEWLHQSMLNLSQQHLLFPTNDLQVGHKMLQQKSITSGHIHELLCQVTRLFFHILPRLCDKLATSRTR